jgi:hypothetical protein
MAGYCRVVLAVLMVLGYSSSTAWAMEAELKCSACEAVVRMLLFLHVRSIAPDIQHWI